jgi:hypothetical protein
MKKTMWLSMGLVFLMITVLSMLPCQAQDVLQGCAKAKKGQLRIVSDPSECKKSEYPVTLNGSALPQNPLPQFNGEVCWNLLVTEEREGPREPPLQIPIQTHINYMGKHYLMSGYVATPPPMNPIVVSGSAVVVGDKIVISSILTFDDSSGMERSGAVMEMRLDNTTLSGVFWIVSNDFETDTRESHSGYSAGTVTKTSCP